MLGLSDTAEVAWTQSYGTNGNEDGISVATAGEGFFCAFSLNYGDGETNITLIQTTSAGAEVWSKEYEHVGSSDSIAAIEETIDGGCILVGSTNSYSVGGDMDIWVLCVDGSGEEYWNVTLGGTDEDTGSDILALPGGGFLVIGTRYQVETGNDVYIASIDADGVLNWENTYGGTDADSGIAITALSSGGYAFIASSVSTDGDVHSPKGAQDFWVGAISADGILTDEWSFGSLAFDEAIDIVADDDGILYCTGQVYALSGDVDETLGGSDIWLFALENGNIVWQSTCGGNGDDVASALALRDDGELICTGSSTSTDGQVTENAGGKDVWTFAVNSSTGSLLWNVTSGGTGDDYGCDIALPGSMEIAIMGTTDSGDAGYSGYHGGMDALFLYLEESSDITTSFSADATSGEAPFTVSFTDTSTGRGTTWLWDFGDGETSPLQNPEHIYSESGVYTVTLTVSDEFGHSDILTETGWITAGSAWTLPMTLNDGSGDHIITAGCSHSATDGFDTGLDILAPPAPPGGGLYTYINTPMSVGSSSFSAFVYDVRPVVDADNLNESWKIVYTSGNIVTLSWDASSLAGTPIILSFINGSETIDMRTEDTCSLPAGSGIFYVNASYDTVNPVISGLSPIDDSCHYPAPADITVSADYSDNLGINASAVVLTANGEDVTSASTVTTTGISYIFSAEEGEYSILLSVADLGGKTESAEWNFTVTNATCLEIALSPGWNMVSYPFEEDGLSAAFPDEVIQCFVYNATSSIYESADIGCNPGVGYWVAATDSSVISLSGTCLQQYDANLLGGWNLFGSLILSVPVDSLPDGINQDTVYRYNTTARIYEASASIEPGFAYWVHADMGGVPISLSL